MSQDVCGSSLNSLPALTLPAGLSDGVTQSLRQTRNDSGIVASEVVQLDGFWDAIIFFRVFRCAE